MLSPRQKTTPSIRSATNGKRWATTMLGKLWSLPEASMEGDSFGWSENPWPSGVVETKINKQTREFLPWSFELKYVSNWPMFWESFFGGAGRLVPTTVIGRLKTTGHGFHLWGTSRPPGPQKVSKWPFSPLEMMYEQNSASKNGWWIYWHGLHASQGVPTLLMFDLRLVGNTKISMCTNWCASPKIIEHHQKRSFPFRITIELLLNNYWTTDDFGIVPQTPNNIYHHIPSSTIFQVSAFQGVGSTSMDRWLLQVLPSNAA